MKAFSVRPVAVPWELGPAGVQTARVVSIDPLNNSYTYERKGEDDGEAENEIKNEPLLKDKKTSVVDVTPGKGSWSGNTTFCRGFIMSDVLLVRRSVRVSSKEIGEGPVSSASTSC
jgi:hypothetical protein